MKIAVLMSTYNGEKYIAKQLDSIMNQSINCEMVICIRDDGSTDRTLDIINLYSNSMNIVLYKGKNIGAARSFWRLFCNKEIMADYYAFSDQDDIWDINKLDIAVSRLEKCSSAALWCSNCRLIDGNDKIISYKMNEKDPKFDSCSQFVCGTTQGCAMVFNNELREIIISQKISTIPMHDFVILTYAIQLGVILYDKHDRFSYRIHASNTLEKSGKSIIKKVVLSFEKFFSKKSRNVISKYAGEYAQNLELYLSNDEYKYIRNLSQVKKSFTKRLLVVLNKKTKNKNLRGEISFILRTLLGVI